MYQNLLKTTLLTFGLALSVVAPAAATQADSDTVLSAPDTRLSEAESDTLIDEIKQAVVEAEEFSKALSNNDHFDLSFVVEAQGFEPEKLLDWVTNETRWTPYPGRLRGSSGVLMDRRGNSLDRSLRVKVKQTLHSCKHQNAKQSFTPFVQLKCRIN